MVGCVVLDLIWLEWSFQVCIKVFERHAFGVVLKEKEK